MDYLLRQQNIEISTDTLRRMILRGDLTGYRLPGSRLIFVDLDEIDVLMKPVDAAVAAS